MVRRGDSERSECCDESLSVGAMDGVGDGGSADVRRFLLGVGGGLGTYVRELDGREMLYVLSKVGLGRFQLRLDAFDLCDECGAELGGAWFDLVDVFVVEMSL